MATTTDINDTNYEATINGYVDTAEGLKAINTVAGSTGIRQDVDGKSIELDFTSVEEVIERVDPQGKSFLQINLLDGKKILLTSKLIGFKPLACKGLDMSKLPKVVTTPDLISVFEAIEETIGNDTASFIEVDVLKKVFRSVISGGEQIGFNLSNEKTWLGQIDSLRNKFIA